MEAWFNEHWFDLAQTVGIIASLLVAAYTLYRDERARRINNLVALKEQYIRLWREFYDRPALSRVLRSDADPLKEHTTVGAVVGGGVDLLWQICRILDDPNRPKDFWEFLSRIDFLEIGVCALGGAVCAALPDVIEPATTPNHRAAFHSIACAGAISYGAFGKHTQNLLPEQRHALRIAALAYLSHLLLGGETPKGLPILGLPKFEV